MMVKVGFISFKQAVMEAEEKSLFKKNNSWLGKKVYLGYCDRKGWKVYELGLIKRFFRSLGIVYRNTHYKKIVTRLDGLSKQDAFSISPRMTKKMLGLNKKLKAIYQEKVIKSYMKTPSVIKVPAPSPSNSLKITLPTPVNSSIKVIPSYESILKNKDEPLNSAKSTQKTPNDSNTKENDVPQNQVISQTNKPISENTLVSLDVPAIKKTKNSVEEVFVMPDTISSAIHPLRLKNIGNSCYLDSVMEMMLSQTYIRQQIFQAAKSVVLEKQVVAEALLKKDLLKKDELNLKRQENSFKRKEIVLQGLIQLIENSKEGSGGIKALAIRKAIFEGGFHYDFNLKNPFNISKQHDAAGIFLIFMGDLLNISFNTKQTDTIGSGQTFARAPELNYLLMANLQEGKNVLTDIIGKQFEKDGNCEKRKFTIEGVEKELPYVMQKQIVEMPEIMGIQLKRFGYDVSGKKKSDPVTLPEDGIIDLSSYFSGNNTEGCKYKITGYVVHSGSLGGGHYVSNVEIEGQYFHCDDTSSTYHKMSKEEFFGNKDSYLILLKKIPAPLQPEKPSTVSDVDVALKSNKGEAVEKIEKVADKAEKTVEKVEEALEKTEKVLEKTEKATEKTEDLNILASVLQEAVVIAKSEKTKTSQTVPLPSERPFASETDPLQTGIELTTLNVMASTNSASTPLQRKTNLLKFEQVSKTQVSSQPPKQSSWFSQLSENMQFFTAWN